MSICTTVVKAYIRKSLLGSDGVHTSTSAWPICLSLTLNLSQCFARASNSQSLSSSRSKRVTMSYQTVTLQSPASSHNFMLRLHTQPTSRSSQESTNKSFRLLVWASYTLETSHLTCLWVAYCLAQKMPRFRCQHSRTKPSTLGDSFSLKET